MFEPILRIFDFLSLSKTQEQYQPRKPMAIPLDPRINSLNLCKNIFTKLDVAEADVLQNIDDPEKAWQILSNIRQLRRETIADLLSLLPEGVILANQLEPVMSEPVCSVLTRTGAKLAVYNGGKRT